MFQPVVKRDTNRRKRELQPERSGLAPLGDKLEPVLQGARGVINHFNVLILHISNILTAHSGI